MSLDQVSIDTENGVLHGIARSGAGTPIVLLHGVLADAASWIAVAEQLAPSRPLLLPNRRGRTPGTELPDDYRVRTEIDDLRAWLATFEGEVDLVGHSYGGLVATEAVREGANVRSLTLYEPVTHPFAPEALPALEEADRERNYDRQVALINVAVSGYSPEYVRELRASSSWQRLTELAVPAASEIRQINAHRLREGGLPVPVALIAGELSRYRAPYGPSVDRYASVMGVEPFVLAGHDHLAHLTGPSDLASLLERLVSQPGGGGGEAT